MAAESMSFPETVDEFMEQYKIVDTEQVYTNGVELVPIFRMQQWFEHLPTADVRPVVRGEWEYKPNLLSIGFRKYPIVECNKCCVTFCDVINSHAERYHFCPNCGADMRGGNADA